MFQVFVEKIAKPFLFRIGEAYIRLCAHVSQRLPIEKNIYVIDHDNKMKNITLQYFVLLGLHSHIFQERKNYLVEYRHISKKKVIDNDNLIGVMNKVRSVGTDGGIKIKIPIINFIIAINDIALGYEEKKRVLSHDRDDNLDLVYRLYNSESITKVSVELKGHKKEWDGDECKILRVGDILY